MLVTTRTWYPLYISDNTVVFSTWGWPSGIVYYKDTGQITYTNHAERMIE